MKGIKAYFTEMVKSRMTPFLGRRERLKELSQRRLHAAG